MKKIWGILFILLLICVALPCYASDMPVHSDVVEWDEQLAENIRAIIYDDGFMYVSGWGELDFDDYYLCGITGCYIEEGFTSIAEDAFRGASEIEYIHLPDSLRRIEDSAFYGCYVGDLVLPPNLEYIGQDAFYGALGRTLVINGNNLVIDRNAFAMCQSLQTVTSVTKTPVTFCGLTFFANMELQELTFAGPVIFNGTTFNSCRKLKKITLGEGTTVLPTKCFETVNTLSELTLPSTITKIETETFSYLYKPLQIYYYGTPEDWVKIQLETTMIDASNVHFLGKPEPIIDVTVNGKRLTFDQPPVLQNDRTLVPLRAIFTELGAEILWDDATKTVTATKGETVIKMQIDNAVYTVNGTEKTLDVPAQLINDRTLIPVRAVAESFNCTVNWEDTTKTVEIISN
ncbi:MAG: leucine-rich repeat protein [Clostridia bacterium]|nr:leucine-rich repeat protein [Clostridia bacterium]